MPKTGTMTTIGKIKNSKTAKSSSEKTKRLKRYTIQGMRYLLLLALFIVILVALSGCDVAPTAGVSDPQEALVQAKQDLAAAQQRAENAQSQIDQQYLAIEQTKAAVSAQSTLTASYATATADAFNAEATRAQATGIAAIATQTYTAEMAQARASQTAIAGATQTAQPPIATATAIAQHAIDYQIQKRQQWEWWDMNVATVFWKAFPIVAGILILIGIAVAGVWGFRLARREVPQFLMLLKLHMSLYRRGKSQSPLYAVPTTDGRFLFVNQDLAKSPGLVVDPATGQIQEAQIANQIWQAQHNAAEQAVKAIEALPPQLGSRRAARDTQETLQMFHPKITEISMPSAAPWELVSRSGPAMMPLGMSAKGPIIANLETRPHWLIAGTTGSGKTRRVIIPMVTSALVNHYDVLLLNTKGGDYGPVRGHPNLTEYGAGQLDARGVADVLELVQTEVWDRDQILSKYNASTWSRLPDEVRNSRAYVFVVVEEFVDLANAADRATYRRLMQAAIRVTNIGRAMNASLILSTTDPTEKTLGRQGMIVRANCGRLLFRVESGAVSQALLGQAGAEALSEGRFLTKAAGDVVEGVAFDPQLSQVKDTLDSRPVADLPTGAWKEIKPRELPAGGVNDGAGDLTSEQVDAIKAVWEETHNLAEVQRRVFDVSRTGGGRFLQIKEVLGLTV